MSKEDVIEILNVCDSILLRLYVILLAATGLRAVAAQAVHARNNTASQFATHSSIVEASGLPVAAAFGFMPGLMLGLRKG